MSLRILSFVVGLAICGCGGSSSEASAVDGGVGGAIGSGGSGGSAMGGSGGSRAAVNCLEFVPQPMMGSCRGAQNNHGGDFTVTGPVLDVAPLSATNYCFYSGTPADAFEFQIADAEGEVWTFAVYIPGFQNPLVKDDVISVKSSFSDSPFFGHESDLEVRDENEALLFYVGESGGLAQLALPDGLAASVGETVCAADSSCGAWINTDLVVTFGGESVVVPYLGSASLGTRRVMQRSSIETSGGGCTDWSASDVALAIH